jgi:hypothetical protein
MTKSKTRSALGNSSIPTMCRTCKEILPSGNALRRHQLMTTETCRLKAVYVSSSKPSSAGYSMAPSSSDTRRQKKMRHRTEGKLADRISRPEAQPNGHQSIENEQSRDQRLEGCPGSIPQSPPESRSGSKSGTRVEERTRELNTK